MGGLKKRIGVLEGGRRRGERQLAREALTYLSTEELEDLELVLESGQENAGERGRRAIEALNNIHEALREGREPQKGATQ